MKRKRYKVGDKVRAVCPILDEQPSCTIVCALPGEVGTIVDVVDDDAFDVQWPDGFSITGIHEIEPATVRLMN